MNKTKKEKRAVIYARGIPESIERQLQACRAYAAQQGLMVGAEVTELKSAAQGQATPFGKLLEQVDVQHSKVVVVTSLDRLSRRFSEVEKVWRELAKRHVQIVTVA